MRDGRLRLAAHARRETFVARLEPRGVDQPHRAAAELGISLSAVARQPRLVVDERKFPARKPVEQSGLADIRPSDDGDSEGHRSVGEEALRAALGPPPRN